MAGHDTPMATGLFKRPVDTLIRPFQEFARVEAAGGIVLLIAAAAAMIWANSPWSHSYHELWHTGVTVRIGSFEISNSLAHWINDGLMALFFFVVGLEVKREILIGELSSLRKASLPLIAAAGGMAVPAMVYVGLNLGTEGARGWAIPAATDIAFALGIVALLGKRVPPAAKVFLTALAIGDDIGAVLVIALFYSKGLDLTALGAGAGILVLLIIANRLQVRKPVVYALLGILLWVAFYKSGVHASIAGVVLAFTIPAKVRIDGAGFLRFSKHSIEAFEAAGGDEDDVPTNPERQAWVNGLEQACEQVQTPLQRFEHTLHPWSSFLVMPIFALSNAGVNLGEGIGGDASTGVMVGIAAGLLIGKPVGILLATWLAIRTGLADPLAGVTKRHTLGVGLLAGIGFTMSLFIAGLAFGEGELNQAAKVGIVGGSLLAGVAGFLVLRSASASES